MFAKDESSLHFVIDRSEDCLAVGRLSILHDIGLLHAPITQRERKEESVR